ncbi:MAG TPA: hypothetical protein PLD55_12455 [bacterium]|nr:hypothetical protein [bacterium]
MSIKGSNPPKIVYRDQSDQLITVTFSDPIKLDYDWNVPDYDIKTSVVTGKKTRIKKGEYHKFNLDILKLDLTLHTSLKAINASDEVRFYPHSDVSTYYTCLVTKLQPYYNKNLVFLDACKLELETDSYVAD